MGHKSTLFVVAGLELDAEFCILKIGFVPSDSGEHYFFIKNELHTSRIYLNRVLKIWYG